MRHWCGFAVLVLLPWVALVRADDAPKPIGPAEEAKKVGEEVVLRMDVKSAKMLSGVCFLNSEADFKDAKNFTIFLDKDALAKFKKAKIEDPADYYEGKTIQVKGKVTLYQDKPQIAVRRRDQIEIVDKK
jgi:DNA/RNA endonuclease YhcR with UshA esterase domain